MVMENRWRSSILGLYLLTIWFVQCDARKFEDLFRILPGHSESSNLKSTRAINVLKRLGIVMPVSLDSSNTQPYVNSPFSLPPYDSLPPIPLPQNAPPSCGYPPLTPQPPSSTFPAPVGGSTPLPPPSSSAPGFPSDNPPPSPMGTIPSPPDTIPTPNVPITVPSPPTILPNPPTSVPSPPTNVPSPTQPGLNPPYFEPSPPGNTPSPTIIVPSPPEFVPRPPVFLPPVVYPPPAVPPPHHSAPSMALWCVAKPSVPEPIIQEAMNYACASGADCDQIKPNGSCYQPDTVLAHASYAFNSYWQRTKVAGGTCEFGGSAMLVTVDPSYDGCHFIYF